MEFPPWAASSTVSLRAPSAFDPLLRAVWYSTCSLLSVLCVGLALRRAVGGLQQPLPVASLLAVAVIASMTATGLRLLAIWFPVAAGSRVRGLWRDVPISLALICLGVALASPGASLGGLFLLWGLFMAEEGVWWYAGWKPSSVDSGRQPGVAVEPPFNEPCQAGTPAPLDALDESMDLLPARMTQHVTRQWLEDGGETISGLIRGDFQSGERTQNLHLAFCPPLAGRPELETNQLEGPPVRIRTAQVESFGVRLELRLMSRNPHPVTVVIQFDATASGNTGQSPEGASATHLPS